MSDPNENTGGFGGSLFQYQSERAADLKLFERAIRNGWNVNPGLKQRILERMDLIVELETDDDLVIKASRVVLEADKADIARERNKIESSKSGPVPRKVTINYNNLTLEELIKLEEIGLKAGIPDASIAADPAPDAIGHGSDTNGQG